MSSPYIPEGWVMGTLGYVMTFVILALLSAIMYVTSKIIERVRHGKGAAGVRAAPAPQAPTAPTAVPMAPTAPELTPEELAAVAVAVHAHLSGTAPSPEEIPSMPATSAWVLRARLDTRSYYGTLTYERIRKRRGWRGGL